MGTEEGRKARSVLQEEIGDEREIAMDDNAANEVTSGVKRDVFRNKTRRRRRSRVCGAQDKQRARRRTGVFERSKGKRR